MTACPVPLKRWIIDQIESHLESFTWEKQQHQLHQQKNILITTTFMKWLTFILNERATLHEYSFVIRISGCNQSERQGIILLSFYFFFWFAFFYASKNTLDILQHAMFHLTLIIAKQFEQMTIHTMEHKCVSCK